MQKKDIEKFIKALGTKYPLVGVSFVEKAPRTYNARRDTACTALARAFLKKQTSYFNGIAQRQLCSGADYYFKFGNVSDDEAIANYVDDEHVFADASVCQKFLRSVPKFPGKLQNKTIRIKPLTTNDTPDIIVLLVTPAQAGRIAGLLNHDTSEEIKFLPNQSTCISLFAPLANGQPHFNFIDYYDRYYQGAVGKKRIWPEDCMIVSITSGQFRTIFANASRSPHGSYKVELAPQKVDLF